MDILDSYKMGFDEEMDFPNLFERGVTFKSLIGFSFDNVYYFLL